MKNNIAKGASSELLLAKHLTEQGYWVFSPVVSHGGPIDLVAISKNGEIMLLDAKTDVLRDKSLSRIYRVRSKVQRELGVKIAYVSEDGKVSIIDH